MLTYHIFVFVCHLSIVMIICYTKVDDVTGEPSH